MFQSFKVKRVGNFETLKLGRDFKN